MIFATDLEHDNKIYNISINKIDINDVIEFQSNKKFTGQKIFHPFKTEKKNFKKGNKTYTDLVYTNEFINNQTEEILANSVFFVKHDGSCGYVLWDGQNYIPYTRYDIKKDKKTKLFAKPQDDWIPCESMPTDELATHWPHFIKCENNKHKWHIDAFNNALPILNDIKIKKSFTCEYMGKKFNGNTTDIIDQNGAIVPHCSLQVIFNKNLISYEGFKLIFQNIPFIEGLVAYAFFNNHHYVYKIRRDMFVDDNNKLSWPNDNISFLSKNVALISHI